MVTSGGGLVERSESRPRGQSIASRAAWPPDAGGFPRRGYHCGPRPPHERTRTRPTDRSTHPETRRVMVLLSAFADEISKDPVEQLDVLSGYGVRHVEFRAIHGVNVLDLSDAQHAEFRDLL